MGPAATPVSITLRIETIGSGYLEATFQVNILPSCHYTEMTPTRDIAGPLSISKESRYGFIFTDTIYRHTFEE